MVQKTDKDRLADTDTIIRRSGRLIQRLEKQVKEIQKHREPHSRKRKSIVELKGREARERLLLYYDLTDLLRIEVSNFEAELRARMWYALTCLTSTSKSRTAKQAWNHTSRPGNGGLDG